LSDVPSYRARTAVQLESIVENALLPNKFDNADAMLSAMRPITPIDGFTHEVLVPYDAKPHSDRLVKILNAAAAIGGVAHDEYRKERYLVRPELFEFISSVAKKSFEADDDNVRISELRQIVSVALQPHIGDHAQVMLNHCHPITEQNGFSSEIILPEIPEHDRPIVRNVLNAGATLQYVSRDERKGEAGRYYLHSQLYKTLALIAASNPLTGNRYHHPKVAAPAPQKSLPPRDGGNLSAKQPQQQQVAPPPRQVTQQSEPAKPPLQQPQVSQDELNELVSQFRTEFLSALGLSADSVDRRLASDGVGEASLEAWRTLQRHGETNERLRRFLKENIDYRDTLLDGTYTNLRRANAGDRTRADMLDKAELQVSQDMSKLMLFPELGVIDNLIENLEHAEALEAGLDSKERKLLLQLRRVQQVMDTADEVDDEAWRKINAVLAEPIEDKPDSVEPEADIDKIVSLFQKKSDSGNNPA
jgi:hypothetical protein